MEREIRKVGNRDRVVLRSDGEPAIKDLLSEVARLRKGIPTVLESTAPGDSRANGLAERAVTSVEEQVRVLQISSEKATGEPLEVSHRGFTWIVEHAAD